MKQLADRVRTRREELGWSQAQLAERLPVRCSQASIGKIESGQTRNPRYIIEIAYVLGVSVEWLKGLTDDPTPKATDVSSPSMKLDPSDWALFYDFKRLQAVAPKVAEALREAIRVQADFAAPRDNQK